MRYIDIPSVCREWFMTKYDSPCDDVNVSRLKLFVNSFDWTELDRGPQINETPRKVQVHFQKHHRNRFSELTVSRKCTVSKIVTLTQTVVKGLQKRVAIEYDDVLPERAIDIFGEILKISPGRKEDREVFEMEVDKTQTDISNERNAEAEIHISESFYKGEFNCALLLKGNVVFTSGERFPEYNIGHIIEEMNETTEGDLDVFDIERNYVSDSVLSSPIGVTWRMVGRCELNWDPRPIIKWN